MEADGIQANREEQTLDALRRTAAEWLQIEQWGIVQAPAKVVRWSGTWTGGSDVDGAFERLSQRFEALGYTAYLQQESGQWTVVAVQGIASQARPGRAWVNLALFAATVLAVLVTGALHEGADLLTLRGWLSGVPFAVTILGILTAHEMSHYLVAQRYGSPVSLPYFVPLPLTLLGTMGAVIVQRAPMRSRKAIFDIGIAGPLGGLVVALPLLVVGLLLSRVEPLPVGEEYMLEGNSLLYLGLKYLLFGRVLPSGGVDVMIHPIAFAAWAGLLVTMFNLLPVGQLDGGHVSYALLGRQAYVLARVLIGAMIAWGGFLLLVPGNSIGWTWILWGFLVATFGPRHPPPLNDASRLDGKRIALGLALLVLLVLIFVPVPLTIVRP